MDDVGGREAAGTQGICRFPDGAECDEWALFRGECGTDHTYCARMGQAAIRGGEPGCHFDDESWRP